MPLLYDEPEPDLVGLGEGLATMRLPSSLAWNTIFKDSQLTGRTFDFLQVDAERSFDAKMRRMTGYSDRIDPQEANERFGIEGSLKFDKPVLEVEAAWQQRRAQERDFKDYVLANSDIGPLSAMGAAIAGTMLDPISWPLMFAPELLGLAKIGQAAVGVRGGMAALKAGRLANAGRFAVEGALEGAVGGLLYEGALNYPLRQAEGEDYRWQDASRNIVLGAVFGAGAKGLLGAMLPPAGRAGEAVDPEAAGLADDIENLTETRLPDAVERLPEEQRGAAATLAIDRMSDDAPVDMGPVFEAQARATLGALDEVPGQPGSLAARYLGEDVAVSTRGTEIPVRYALVELGDLITSHDDDLVRNADYPGALQPRDRGERAGSIAANRGLQGRLHPKLLLEAVSAETGSPIVSRDGVVESGNGRLIAMRRDAAEGGAFWDRYQAALKAAGYEAGDLQQPVLVRVRDNVLTGEQRAALARELNPSMTETMGPREQAMADAAAMPADVLEKLVAGPVDGAANGPFARAFLDALAPDQLNSLVDSAGRLSKDGADRLRAAVMAIAYGDGDLLETVFEQADGPLKSIGLALADAAPSWTRMRADMARGLTPPEVDITGNIRAAVGLIRHAREKRMALPKLLTERTGQVEAFDELGLSTETLTLLNLFYDNRAMTTPRDPAVVSAFLNQYAEQAQAKTPGPDLFGETHEGAARQILENLVGQLARQDGELGDVLARLREEQASPNGGANPAGDAGAVLFDAGRQDGVGGGPRDGGDLDGGGQPLAAGPAAGQPADAVAEGGADAGAGRGDRAAVRAPDANGNETLGLLDAEHADLLMAGRRLMAGEAVPDAEWAVLADRMGRYMDFSDVRGAKAKGAFKDGLPTPQLMAKAAKQYAQATKADPSLGYLSLYDPDRLEEVMRRGIKAQAEGAAPLSRPAEAADAPAGGKEGGGVAAPPVAYGQAFIAADPELKALYEDTRAMLAREGLDGAPVAAKADPDTIATAMRTAALCLLDAAEDL